MIRLNYIFDETGPVIALGSMSSKKGEKMSASLLWQYLGDGLVKNS
jgi:hypothetical protein